MKTKLSTLFLVIAIIAIIIMGVYIYKLNNDKVAEIQKSTELQKQVNSQSNEDITTSKTVDVKIGTFEADEEKFDSAGVSYGECGVTLANNNLCSVYEGFGSSHLGTYSIDENKLICNTLIDREEEGGIAYSEYNVIFEFEILDSQKLTLDKIINNSNKSVNSPGLVEGMTYSYSANSHIKVILDD